MVLQKCAANGGAIVFWTLAKFSSMKHIVDGLAEAGYADCVPEKRTHASALRDALEEVCSKGFLVRPLLSRDGFAVVRESRGADENDYNHQITAKIIGGKGGEGVTLDLTGYLHVSDRHIREAFERHQQLLPAPSVGACLVHVVKKLMGTRLRPNGSVYWLPSASLLEWEKVSKVIEASGIGMHHRVYAMNQVMDAGTIRAVRDSIIAEMVAEAKQIEDEILGGQLGARALESRKQTVEVLKLKIEEYENIMGESLAELKRGLEHACGATAGAAVLAAVEAESDI